MINKLKRDDRLEYLVKAMLIENKFYNERILTYLFGMVGLMTIIAGLSFVGFVAIVIFVILAVRDVRRFIRNKIILYNEYFEIKPRSKK